jgi:hypothetical protein
MGLREGYEGAKIHDLAMVREQLRNCTVQPVTVVSIRHSNGRTRYYDEPAVTITGARGLPMVYELAHALGQQQFSVEDFGGKCTLTAVAAVGEA